MNGTAVADGKFQTVAVKHFQRLGFLTREGIHLGQVMLPIAALNENRLRRFGGIQHPHLWLEQPGFILFAFLLRLRIYEEHGDNPAPGRLPNFPLHDDRRIGVGSRL